MQVEQPIWPPLPGGPPPPLPGGPTHYQQYEPPRYDQQPPWQAQAGGFPLQPPEQQLQQQQQQSGKRKKRGKRGSGLEARQRGLKRQQQQQQPTALGFFGQVPASLQNVPASLQDLRRENRARAAQHFGGGGGGRAQQHGPGRACGHRRSRGGKASKLPKRLAPTPRPTPLTPAAGNPLDTPANVGHLEHAAGGADRLEAEGLQAGLDWYGTNENSAALFLAGQQLTTSDSDFEDDWGELDGEAAQQGNGHAQDDAHSGGSGSGGSGGGEAGGRARGAAAPPGGELYDETALPRAVRARLVEQEAYIAELEDQNLRLREQLDMLQQELAELRDQRHAGDSEEGFAEHSEGSLPADLSVMNHPP